ncbi:alkylphosphonate utilization protein [Psychrobium sp. 1_MG-2023]|uniref:PhnA domain-containing protein n=1 Tax=Psychrobium sp. 1_MG-2023 TaxID=3062624 RepID=UPI000C32A7E2|nr:alkylphosphonate utilization protein [Psychrobium sp. 1_MG-2023]MDP2560389.1 PhnA domain-containing protein [Psychrobium sp. 1_MG-2023]PKF57942.1 PhnA domain protein [Alteromonadales bacterium alter-6D02]
MSIEATLQLRSNSQCELCSSNSNLTVYEVPPTEAHSDKCVLLCDKCHDEITQAERLDVNHWRCLNDSMWSQVPVVQVMAYRMLTRLINAGETWAQDLLDMLYLDDETLAWANKGSAELNNEEPHLDSNGAVLSAGDNVVLIKDLVVKGANFTAKRGTAVRGISLSPNPEHIEGRVNGTRIVIITQYVKKM